MVSPADHAEPFKLVDLSLFRSLNQPSVSKRGRSSKNAAGLICIESAAALPAIYVLQLRKPAKFPAATQGRAATPPDLFVLREPAVRLDRMQPHRLRFRSSARHIHSIRDGAPGQMRSLTLFSGSSLDLSGFLLLPGLINAHDHLEFSLFPNIGDGPYQNAAQWAR